MLQLPAAPTVAVPREAVPLNTVTVAPTSPLPVSDVAFPPVKVGAGGFTVSMVTDLATETALMLPARSTAWAMMLCTPSVRVFVAMVHVPPVAVAVPIFVVPSNRLTVLPASAVPVKTGALIFVM